MCQSSHPPLQSYPLRLHPQVTNQPNPTVPSKAILRPHAHLIQHAPTAIHTKSNPLINENPDNHTQSCQSNPPQQYLHLILLLSHESMPSAEFHRLQFFRRETPSHLQIHHSLFALRKFVCC